MEEFGAFIDGKWQLAQLGAFFSVANPATGEIVGRVADCDASDVNLAIDAAVNAFEEWRFSSAMTRYNLLMKIRDNLIAEKEYIANILTQENGKPITEARGEVGFAASFFQWFAEESRRAYGETIPSGNGDKTLMTIRQAAGVAAMITPWNFPIGMIGRKVSAALASGCACVLKPAEDTPLTAMAFAKVLEKSGVPPGLVNIVPCSHRNVSEVGKVMSTHPEVRVLSFTGSSAVGKILYAQCSTTVKKLSLELGGNAPFIIFPSADMDKAVKGSMAAKFRNSGQTCVSSNRIYVHSSIVDEFVTKFAAAMEKELVVGDGRKEGVTQGPIINQRQHKRLCKIVDDSVAMGAKVVVGGKPKGGLFYEPTILVNISTDMPIYKEEIFGPVAAISTFQTEEEVLKLANDSNMGLVAYFYTSDLSQTIRVSERLEAGMLGVNEGLLSTCEAPFGGIKHSGIGKEGSKHGLDEYSHIKYICINTK